MNIQQLWEHKENSNRTTSLWGVALLYSGTVIGAGMLALPLETINAGYLPSIVALFTCWLFTVFSSLLVLEATFTAAIAKDNACVSFLSIASLSLGLLGRVITCGLYLFILWALLVSYIAGGGDILVLVGNAVLQRNPQHWIASLIFVFGFGICVFLGSKWCDYVNRFLTGAVVLSFVILIICGLPKVNFALLAHQDWSAIWPGAIAVGIIAFMAQNVVPVLVSYAKDVVVVRKAIFLGSVIPLLMYIVWELVILGIVPFENVTKSADFVTKALSAATGYPKLVNVVTSIFSLFAIASSFLGVSLSSVELYLDFFDASQSIGIFHGMDHVWRRPLAVVGSLVIPFLFAVFLHDAFVVAMENSGLLGGLSIYGIIPAVVVWIQRTQRRYPPMIGRLGGGLPVLVGFLLCCITVILLHLIPRLGDLFFSHK
jgi:tyrosine-specific transport protein